jgi:hypothetical protein
MAERNNKDDFKIEFQNPWHNARGFLFDVTNLFASSHSLVGFSLHATVKPVVNSSVNLQ